MRDKVKVTTRALVQRINRKLKPELRQLRKARERARTNVGEYYVIDYRSNSIIDRHVDVEAMARKLKVIGGWEVRDGSGLFLRK